MALIASAVFFAVAESSAAGAERPPQLLLITVIQTADTARVHELLGSGTAGGIPVRRWRTRRMPGEDFRVQVQVLEGRKAFVHLRRTVPDVELVGVEGRYGHRRPVPYVRPVSREYGEGFYVEAELAGNDVVLDLYGYSDLPWANTSPGIAGQALKTTVSGRIGQWLDAGGSLDISRDQGGPSDAVRTYSTRHIDRDTARLLIRAELVRFGNGGEARPYR